MRSPLILTGQTGNGVLTIDQMRRLVMALANIQPTRVEMQLSLLARTLVISAKGSGISDRVFFTELRKIWDETTGKELGPSLTVGSSTGLQPTGPT